MPKQGTKLHYCCKGRSLDRLWADANRPGHHRTAVSYARTGAMGCHEDQQLDRVFGIRESWAIQQQVKCAKEKSAREEINRPGGKTHRGFCFASRNDGFLAVTSVFGRLPKPSFLVYFFQPLPPSPSGASAGAISGVRSTSSGVSSQSTSMRDFS